MKKSHYPLLFIDEISTLELPPPEFLSIFHIVIISSQRLIYEWKNGSVEDEIQFKNSDKKGLFQCDGIKKSACPLLKVYWLRLVVDEGHSMGCITHTNCIQFSSWIQSERRWAISGTPTPQRSSYSGLRNIYGLLKFLKHDYLCPKKNGMQRWKLLSKGFSNEQLGYFFQLLSLLGLLMIRHAKEDIEDLPKPHFQRTYIDMSSSETLAYNTLVTAVQMNIVATSMKGKTSGWQDSLTNPRQAKHAQLALSNIRLACSGGTRISPTLKKENWDETLYLLRNNHNVDEIKLKVVDNFLRRLTTEQLSSCMHCGLQLQTLFLLPCACLICTECITSRTIFCPSCKKKFEVDDFQRLQPGLEYSWKWNLDEAQKKKVSSAQLRGNLQTRIIEDRQLNRNGRDIQTSYITTHRSNANSYIDISTCTYDCRRQSRKKDDHICNFPSFYTDGKCFICIEVHNECNFLNNKGMCPICRSKIEYCPDEESKACYVIKKLLQLLKGHEQIQNDKRSLSPINANFLGQDIIPEIHKSLKVIVFSQFRQILNIVGDRLIRRMGTGCIAEFWGETRLKELQKFSFSPQCFCMLLGRDGSHGLDLSYVTHIFFLDEIMDKSLECQVIARAYRMGATGHVKIEQLVARHSVEQLIVHMNEELVSPSNNVSIAESKFRSFHEKEKIQKQAKIHYLLKRIKLIRKSECFSNIFDTPNYV